MAHVFNENTLHRFKIVASASNEDSVNTLVHSVDEELSKDDNVLRVQRTVGDPVFLSWKKIKLEVQ